MCSVIIRDSLYVHVFLERIQPFVFIFDSSYWARFLVIPSGHVIKVIGYTLWTLCQGDRLYLVVALSR